MKRLVVAAMVAIMGVMNLQADLLSSDSCNASAILSTQQNADIAQMLALLDESAKLLEQSQNILALSEQMMNNTTTITLAMVSAMLRLSDDIGKMADRIGEMADRIVATELQIGIMADRILETQKLQNENVALTEANILKAQKNFNDLLLQLSK